MKLRTAIVAVAAIYLGTAALPAQNCAFTAGNICLDECGVFTSTCYDFPDYNDEGEWSATAVYPDCTATCSGSAIGVDYCSSQYQWCGDFGDFSEEKAELLQRAAPGAPIFTPSCSGGLVPAGVLRRRGVSSVASPNQRSRALVVRQFLKEK
jgi:hypothetical protein